MEGGSNETSSSGLFAVFLLAMYSLFLFPFSIYSLCAAQDEGTTQPVVNKVRLPAYAGCFLFLVWGWCEKGGRAQRHLGATTTHRMCI